MVEVFKTGVFDRWLAGLQDLRAAVRVQVRIDRLAPGRAGDVRPVGGGVSEMRIDVGPGYRAYFMRGGEALIVLLVGGDKSTQARDIELAKAIAATWPENQPMDAAFSRYDTADYLTSDDRIAAYLEAVAEEADPALTLAALSAVARARNMAQLARDAGMTREGLYKALAPDGNPGFATVARIARALGLRLRLDVSPPPAPPSAPR